jgi:fatty-acyl-CoA synthase
MATQPANRVELSPLTFLDRAAAAFGGRPAVVDGDLRLSYRTFRDHAHQLAAALRAAGVRVGDRVAVLAPNGLVLLASHFGVPLAGGVLVAINTRLAPGEITHILAHAGARILLVDGELWPAMVPALEACPALERVVVAGGDAAGAAMSEGHGSAAGGAIAGEAYEAFLRSGRADVADTVAGLSPFPASEDDPICINYTSGTTGTPKGVVYTHRGAYLNALSVALELRLGPDSVYLWTLPMFHCNGWCLTWGVTAVGATHVAVRKVDPPVVWDLIERERVTHFCAAPTVLIALANDPSARRQGRDGTPGAPGGVEALGGTGAAARPARPARPVTVATGGAPPSPTTIAQMNALGVNVTHLYGLTEVYGPSHVCSWWPEWDELPAGEQARRRARQGVPHAGLGAARVVDAALRDVPADGETMGEVVIRGNTVMAGYYRDEAATAEAFRGGWFHTGDLGVVHPDGYVELRDRAKDVIISGGENISTIEIEQVLARHPAVLEVAVVGVPDPQWGEVPKAFVTLKPYPQATAAELIAFCRQHLARFKAPKAIEFGDLPKTSTGKIQKHALRAREWQGRPRQIN